MTPTKITGVENTAFYPASNAAYFEWKKNANAANGYEYIIYDNSKRKFIRAHVLQTVPHSVFLMFDFHILFDLL